MCAPERRLHFVSSPIESPIYPTAEATSIGVSIFILEENAAHMGPFAKAIIQRYSGPVSVIDVVD